MFLKKPKRVKPFSRAARMSHTFWNGEPAECSKVKVVMGAAKPGWWCEGMEGQIREAVKVVYRGQTFYIDNQGGFGGVEEEADFDGRHVLSSEMRPGDGWLKVTVGMGSPSYRHAGIQNCEEYVPSAETTALVENFIAGQ
jgi:hypothetical protein